MFKNVFNECRKIDTDVRSLVIRVSQTKKVIIHDMIHYNMSIYILYYVAIISYYNR